MPGLANSRHAPRRPSSSTSTSTITAVPTTTTTTTTTTKAAKFITPAVTKTPPPPPPLTVTPAPTSNGIDNSKSNSHVINGGAPTSTTTSVTVPTATHELIRYTMIVRRLKWKLTFLAAGYRQAVSRVGQAPALTAEAELMFKLDFFDYYMLVERALVHLLGVFGLTVSRGMGGRPRHRYPSPDGITTTTTTTRTTTNGLAASGWSKTNGNNNNGDRTGKDGGAGFANNTSDHRYHANVLEALDNPLNPLHAVLGKGDVRRQLGRAKDLRNRWKTAGDEPDSTNNSTTKRIAAPLESYDLEGILESVFNGFDAAFVIADRFVRSGCKDSSLPPVVDTEMTVSSWADDVEDEEQQQSQPSGNNSKMVGWTMTAGSAEEETAQWEFMVDAMDWEAV